MDSTLFEIKRNRVVLDEAQYIRNSSTNAAKHCCKLMANKRWCLSGTPVQNKIQDLYSLLKFLKCTPFDDPNVFNKYLVSDNEGKQDRLNPKTELIHTGEEDS